MNSFQEFDCIISEERIGFPIQPFYQNNYSSFQLNSQSLIDFQEGEKSRNEINEAEFHKLIKKQINDLVYKDQEIGYHILLIDEQIKLEEESNIKINAELFQLIQGKKNMNEEIQKLNQKLVKQITEKSHVNQRFDHSRKIFNEFKNRKKSKETRLSEISNSTEQFELLKHENSYLKKNLGEDIDFLKYMNQNQEMVLNEMKFILNETYHKKEENFISIKNLEQITNFIRKKKDLEGKKLILQKNLKKIEKLKNLEESLKMKENKFREVTHCNYEKKISELVIKIADLNKKKQALIEFKNNFNVAKDQNISNFLEKLKSNQVQNGLIQILRWQILQINSNIEISDEFSQKLKIENKELNDFFNKILQDKKNIINNLMDKSQEDMNFKISELKIFQTQSVKMNEKFFSLKNKTENFINLSAKINEEIKITKFDLALLLNQDPTKILNSNKESISSARKEIQENIILQKAKKLIKSSKKKENSENLLPYLQNPKNLNKHRVIHSMKLEINTKILEEKMVKTQRNRRIIRIRSLSYCNNKSNKKILQEKRKSYDFESLAERKSKQDKSLLPKNKTICTNSIYKLKEENIPYSSLFSFRMGKNSPKNQEITLFETLNNIGCEKNVILDEIIEQKNFLQTKEKCIVFDFQILMMLMITLIFTIIKKEVQLVVKITVWPFKILTYMNGFIMGRFLSRKN